MSIQDERYANYEQSIVEGQEKFYDEHGKPWQGIISHENLPQGGNEKAADNWEEAPTDQGLPWKDALPEFGLNTLDKNWTQAIRIDTWATPLQVGYTVTRKWLDSEGEQIEREHNYVVEDNTAPAPKDPYETVWVKADNKGLFSNAMLDADLAEKVEQEDGTTEVVYTNGVHWIGDFWAEEQTWDDENEEWTGGTLDGRRVGGIRVKDPSVLKSVGGITVLDSKPSGALPVLE
jgi:hypothetical protein